MDTLDQLRGPGRRWAIASLSFTAIFVILVAYAAFGLHHLLPPPTWMVVAYAVDLTVGCACQFMVFRREAQSRSNPL